jgi:hypothetical protein
MTDFSAARDARCALVQRAAGVEVARVVPIRRVPKTTSGKLQRYGACGVLYDGEFAAEIAEFDQRGRPSARPRPRRRRGVSSRTLKAIVDDLLPARPSTSDDNLFDVGASSSALIQIHERIDETWPGLSTSRSCSNFPTISQPREAH